MEKGMIDKKITIEENSFGNTKPIVLQMPNITLGQNEPRVIAKTASIGFRPNIDNIDEIVTDNCRLHLEFMDNDLVWMDIELPNGEEYHINIYHKDDKCHKHLKCSGERVK